MNNLDKAYQALLQDILDNGIIKEDRTGTGTLSVFGRQIRHQMSEGYPLLTTKKMAFKTMVTELLWFLRGDTNIKYLVEFAKKWGKLGPIYGAQWRSWDWDLNPEPIDQIQNLINDLKTNPDSRRLMVNAWNVGEMDQMVLPPCHYGFQVYTQEMTLEERLEWNHQNSDPLNRSMDYFPEHLDSMGVPKRKISLMWNQRSVDTFLGLPFNIASYGLLLQILAKEVNMVPDELVGNLGDTHLYLNHITQAKEQVKREPYSLKAPLSN
jgi:thymidylate synthase